MFRWCVLFCVALSALKGAGPPKEFSLLSEGQRVKVEAKPEGKKLIIREIEPVESDDEFEIEGPIFKLDRQKGTFRLALWTIQTYERTQFQTGKREPCTFADLVEGARVKVRARRLSRKKVRARLVRNYGPSPKTSVEIIAPVQALRGSRAEVQLVSARLGVDRKTRYLNFPGLPARRDQEENIFRYIRRDDDEQNPDPIRLGRLYLGGNMSFTHERRRDHDLDSRNPDADDGLTPSTELEVSAPLGEFSEAYVRLNFNRPAHVGEDRSQRSTADFSVREAFFYVGNFLHPSLGLQIGRQRFRDKREWLYDDRLDAVRLHFARSRLKVELSAAKGLVGPTGSRSDQYHFTAYSEYRLPGRRYLSGYLMKRNDLTSRDEDPIWFGLSSRGRVTSNLNYWTEFAGMRGRRGPNLLRGYGYDSGGSYLISLPLQPTLSLGYAFGSGDNNLADGVDGNFRQTRLNDNSYRHNGLKRYRYYGVLLEPELSNLKVTTADLGLNPSERWSVNFSYHLYRQAVAYKKLGDALISLEPRGRDPRLGKELDVVLALRVLPRTDLNFYAGLFLPGPAFQGKPPRAFLFRQEMRFYF